MRPWIGLKRAGFVAMSHACTLPRKAIRTALWVFAWLGLAFQLGAQSNQPIYTDALQNGWQDWSWGATRDFNTASPTHSGSRSISASLTAWGALSLHHADMDSSAYTNLTFWIHGGPTGGQRLRIYAELGSTAQPGVSLPALTANTWQQLTFSLASLGAANQPNLARFSIQDSAGTTVPTFYVDDIMLVTNAVAATSAPVAITVNAALNSHPISPMIYGVAFATSNQLAALNSPVNRSGGNSETRYNWQLNAHNRANDWYFESLADSPATAGAAADKHVANSQAGGAAAMLTVPMIGWMPRLGANRARLASYSIAKYGPQAASDAQWFPDAGNGVSVTNNKAITWNDPKDANFATNSAFQEAWIRHLTNRWGISTNGGVRFYCMDNEHTLWHSTHRDVHPVGATMREIRDKFFDYAGRVKAVDPGALLLAPEEWGWTGYLYSGFDSQWASTVGSWNPSLMPDRTTNGGWDYLPWFLDQARQRQAATGQRLLDIFTVHIYPQGGEFSDDISESMQLRRNQSTRALWDTNYVDPTWINSVVKLIPRIKGWVASYYPGTRTGITEYNWGAENHMNGATAQADILGIFGREGLDYATRWTTPSSGTPVFKAMQMYRNYDGARSTFGDVSVSATGTNPDQVATFAALRTADGALTFMAINKQLTKPAAAVVSVTNFMHAGVAEVWRLTSANAITRLADVPVNATTFSNTLPAQSITLFVLRAGTRPSLGAERGAPGGRFRLKLSGQGGQRYAVESSADLVTWGSIQTNLLSGASMNIDLPASAPRGYFRVRWVP
jgi:hypothetical protein